jgi:hypothetical protein
MSPNDKPDYTVNLAYIMYVHNFVFYKYEHICLTQCDWSYWIMEAASSSSHQFREPLTACTRAAG